MLERQEVEIKKSIVNLFLARFTLTEDEVEAMTSRDVPLGKTFFQAMDKTEQIRDECRVLMAGEEGPTKAGCVALSCFTSTSTPLPNTNQRRLDIMASTSSYLEQGYDKISRWCSYEFRQIGRDSQMEVSSIMREAVRRLRKRPELLTCVPSSQLRLQLTDIFTVRPSPSSPRPDKPPSFRPSSRRSHAGVPLVCHGP